MPKKGWRMVLQKLWVSQNFSRNSLVSQSRFFSGYERLAVSFFIRRCLGVSIFRKTKGLGKRGHIVADTLLPMMFLGLRKLGNICCGHKMFLNKIRNIFCVPDTKFVSATNVARAGKRGNICVGNNVSATVCPRLPEP